MDIEVQTPILKGTQTQVGKAAGFRPPRLDYFITSMEDIDKNDSINKKIIDMNIHASSIINIEIKSRPDPATPAEDTTVIVFYKTKVDGTRYRVDYFFTTVGDIEKDDACNKRMAIKNISANDIISVTSTRCKRNIGLVPNIMVMVHIKRQPNGAD